MKHEMEGLGLWEIVLSTVVAFLVRLGWRQADRIRAIENQAAAGAIEAVQSNAALTAKVANDLQAARVEREAQVDKVREQLGSRIARVDERVDAHARQSMEQFAALAQQNAGLGAKIDILLSDRTAK